MTNFDDYVKKEIESWSLWEKFTWWLSLNILPKFRNITKICPHDGTFGIVNSKTSICLDCGKEVHK